VPDDFESERIAPLDDLEVGTFRDRRVQIDDFASDAYGDDIFAELLTLREELAGTWYRSARLDRDRAAYFCRWIDEASVRSTHAGHVASLRCQRCCDLKARRSAHT
jgi:hypothetical protein